MRADIIPTELDLIADALAASGKFGFSGINCDVIGTKLHSFSLRSGDKRRLYEKMSMWEKGLFTFICVCEDSIFNTAGGIGGKTDIFIGIKGGNSFD